MKHRGVFFLILFLIILLGGAGFYFGWIQIQLDENSYAVIFTKMHGYDEEVVRPGTFLWRWDRLVPTNMTVHTFTVTPQRKNVSLSGSLPSSDIYASYLEGSPDFSYNLSFRVSFSIRPESLPELLREHHVTPDTLGSWYQDVFSRCLMEGTAMLEEKVEAAASSSPAGYLSTSLGSGLMERLSGLYPQLEFHSILPETIELPDFDLYRQGKSMYLSLMSEKEAAEAESIRRSSEFFVTESVRLDMLEKYGKLLTEYPILLDYMKLGGVTDIRDIEVKEVLSNTE